MFETDYSVSAGILAHRFMVGFMAGGNFIRIASQGRSTTSRNARIVFSAPTQSTPNLILRLERGNSIFDVSTAVTLRNTRLCEMTLTEETTPVAEITQDNAFSFSIPVKSRVLVNKVNVEYYELVDATEDRDADRITIRRRDCVFDEDENGNRIRDSEGRYRFSVEVPLEKVYERIDDIGVTSRYRNTFRFENVLDATASTLTLQLSTTNTDFSKFEIEINPTDFDNDNNFDDG